MMQGHQEIIACDWNSSDGVIDKGEDDVFEEEYFENKNSNNENSPTLVRRKKFSFTVVFDEFDERERGSDGGQNQTGDRKMTEQQQIEEEDDEDGELNENKVDFENRKENDFRNRSKSCIAKIQQETTDSTTKRISPLNQKNNSPPDSISDTTTTKKPSPIRRKKYSFTVILDDYAQIEKFNNDLMRARACSTLSEEGSQASSSSDISAMNSSESIDKNFEEDARKRSSSLISFRCSHEIYMGSDPPPTPTKSENKKKNSNRLKLSPDHKVDCRRRASDTDIKVEKKRQKSIFSFRKQKKHRLNDAVESQVVETTFPKSLTDSPILTTTSRKNSTLSPKPKKSSTSRKASKSSTASPKLSVASRKSSISPKLTSRLSKESSMSPKLQRDSTNSPQLTSKTTPDCRKSSTTKVARKISLPFIKHVAPTKSIDDETSDEQSEGKEKRKMSKKNNVTFPANLDIQRNTILSSGDIDETTDCCFDTVVAMAELNKDFKKKPTVAFQDVDDDKDDVFSSTFETSKEECVLEYDLIKMRKKSTIVLTHPKLQQHSERAGVNKHESVSAYTNIVKAIEFATFEIGAKSMKKARKSSFPANLEKQDGGGGGGEEGNKRRRKSQHSIPVTQMDSDNLKIELDDCKTSLIIISTINRLIERRNAISEINTTEPLVVKHAVKFLMQSSLDEI